MLGLQGLTDETVFFDPESLQFSRRDRVVTAPPVQPLAEPTQIARLIVANTMSCNMTCSYCYNDFTPRKRAIPSVVRPELIHRIDEYFDQLRLNTASVTFIGGEPFFDTPGLKHCISHALERAKSGGQTIEITVYTNGLHLQPSTARWLGEQNVSLVFSLDGPPLEHDENRRTLGGGDTAQRILKNIRTAFEFTGQAFRRVRCVSSTPSDLLGLHRYFFALGFNEIQIQARYGPVGSHSSPIEAHIATMQWYGSLLKDGVVISVAPYADLLLKLAHRGEVTASHYPCDAACGSLAVDPTGKLYPCHHFFGERDYRIESGASVLPVRDLFRSVDDREPCASCFARYLCGGECYHRSMTTGAGYFGTIEANCQLRRQLVGPTIDLLDKVLRSNPNSISRLFQGQYDLPVVDQYAQEARSLSEYLMKW